MYGFIEGEPFRLFARRDNAQSELLVLRFECQAGMGVLGIRKQGRDDPPPSTHYEETDIEPSSLRAGRFVHVLSTGQRQSYALSRISPDVARRLPADAWVELQPHTEYGFRYLIASDDDLVQGAPAMATAVADAHAAAGAPAEAGLAAGLPPKPTPVSPQLAESALAQLDLATAVEHLRGEMHKVQALHQRVVILEQEISASRAREADLLDVLARWQQRG